MSKDPGRRSRTPNDNIKLSSCTHSEQDDGQETADNSGKNDCSKLIKDFNREIARYSTMVVALGGMKDSENFREELKKSRRRACTLAKQNKNRLLPHLRNTLAHPGSSDRHDIERLWSSYSSCLEVFEMQMLRTLELLRFFPFSTGKSIFIQTGLQECQLTTHNHRYGSIAVEHLDMPSGDKRKLEADEQRVLQKDIHDIRDMLSSMQRYGDVNPWTVQPDLDKLECSKSLNSGSEESTSVVEVLSIPDYDRQRRRKCICLVSIIMLSIVIFATVLGVCIALLT
ncbi:regulator of G-protein signaling 9-binding protein-like isoform X2 [Lineus longissimus]|uniref:regulator of G-protein signaling 9-binding protein-like isoform X2 n=1 Tax=Lineus longissimus TaxID=88925 RepID=UPI002B4F58C3